jgi:Secretion system C-terminal sorting domain
MNHAFAIHHYLTILFFKIKNHPKMKQLLLSMLCIATFSLSMTAQITINRADFGISSIVRDSAQVKNLTKTGATLPTFGNNQNWDYTLLKDSLADLGTRYYAPAASFGAVPAIFSDAMLATNYAATFQAFSYPSRAYMKLDATGFTQLGYTTNGRGFSITSISGGAADSLIFPPAITRYSSPSAFYKFPITANTAWRSSFKDTSNFLLSVAAFGLNRTPAARISAYLSTDTIMGWGTLRMKNPTGGAVLSYAVLLNRNIVTTVDSFYLAGGLAPAALLGAFGLTQGSSSGTPAIYAFLGIGFKQPLMLIATDAAGRIDFVSRGVLPALGLVLDNKEATNLTVATTVYPNPTTEVIHLEFQKTSNSDWHVMLYDAAGKIITINRVSAAQGNVNQRFTLDSALPSGTYFYNLLDETSLIRANGKVVLSR